MNPGLLALIFMASRVADKKSHQAFCVLGLGSGGARWGLRGQHSPSDLLLFDCVRYSTLHFNILPVVIFCGFVSYT